MKISRHSPLLFASTLLALTSAHTALAAPASGDSKDASAEKIAYSLTIDNDVYFQTDRYYTDGFQFEWKRSGGTLKGTEYDVLSALCHNLECDANNYVQTKSRIGQATYTPSNITISANQPLDHPWAGYLYYERSYDFLSKDGLQQTTLLGQVGILGHYSFADEVQKGAHKVFGSEPPRGWSNQIGNSVGLLAGIERRYAFGDVSESAGTHLRTAGYWNLTAGNVNTSAGLGFNFALGKNLPIIASNDPIHKSSLDNVGAACLVEWLQCSLFGGAEARLVAFNVFLDGNLGRNETDISKKPVVVDLTLGGRLIFSGTRSASSGPFYLQFKVTHRTQEFKSPLPVHAQSFGSLTFGVDF